ncbi:signal peptidase I [Methanobrevibacter sp. DSM 116169]|uniref:signal peptidase I n=1 Tax=Methanobrevibacter sp. DSM 116169 TaxID=3242727 RepID=UPI0038FC86A3
MSDTKEIVIYAVIIIIGLMAAQHMNVVVSGSMEPVFYRGDIVVVEKVSFLGIQEFDPSETKVGDIVVYDAAWYSEPVIHRVINISDINGTKYYTIKGDNNKAPDPYLVEEERITQKVVMIGDQPLIIPKIGYLTIWLKGY